MLLSLFTLVFSWVCSGVLKGLQDVWDHNRWNPGADMRFQAVYEVKHYRDLQKVKQCNFSIFLLKYNFQKLCYLC